MTGARDNEAMVVARLVAMLLLTYGIYFASATPAHARTGNRFARETPTLVYSAASSAPGAERPVPLRAASDDGASSEIPPWILIAGLIGVGVSIVELVVSRSKRKR